MSLTLDVDLSKKELEERLKNISHGLRTRGGKKKNSKETIDRLLSETKGPLPRSSTSPEKTA